MNETKIYVHLLILLQAHFRLITIFKFQVVIWNFAMGDNDIRRYTLPFCSECREVVPAFAQRSQNGETALLFIRNVSYELVVACKVARITISIRTT